MTSQPRSFRIHAEFSRKLPDPTFSDRQMHRYIFYSRAKDVPEGLPKDPNPREQNINRAIYKEIAKSLRGELGTPGTFHLKNKGITILAKDVRQVNENEKGLYEVVFSEGQGIVDGAHTYAIIVENRDKCPDNQYVRLEILTGIEEELIPELASGLNTAMQVQAMSIAELGEKFKWIQNALDGRPYEKQIAYKENQDLPFDARDIVALLTLFNIERYPVNGIEYPTTAYTSKAATLNTYLQDVGEEGKKHYEKLRNILPDILELHDLVHMEARDQWNAQGGRAGKLSFMEYRERGTWNLIFVGEETKHRLYDGALYPMLGAFRWMVKTDKQTGEMKWRGGFSAVKSLLSEVAEELVRSTKDASEKSAHNPNKIGKNRSHWENLFKTVAMRQMQRGG